MCSKFDDIKYKAGKDKKGLQGHGGSFVAAGMRKHKESWHKSDQAHFSFYNSFFTKYMWQEQREGNFPIGGNVRRPSKGWCSIFDDIE